MQKAPEAGSYRTPSSSTLLYSVRIRNQFRYFVKAATERHRGAIKIKAMNLTLTAGILDEVIQSARQAYPREACGLLVGRKSVERFIPMKNISPSAQHYEMDPAELIATFRSLRETGEQLLAIFHSHPHGPAELSKTDLERAYYPEAAHLIVSLANPEHPQTVAFRIIDAEPLLIELHAIV
jgi:proteasome lid subunit RPN8/RPN11